MPINGLLIIQFLQSFEIPWYFFLFLGGCLHLFFFRLINHKVLMNCLSGGFRNFMVKLRESMLLNESLHLFIDSLSRNSIYDMAYHPNNCHIFFSFGLVEFKLYH